MAIEIEDVSYGVGKYVRSTLIYYNVDSNILHLQNSEHALVLFTHSVCIIITKPINSTDLISTKTFNVG